MTDTLTFVLRDPHEAADEIERLRDLVEKREDLCGELIAKKADDWTPIKTAPKDGTPMLFCYWGGRGQDTLPIVSGFWSRLNECWYAELSGEQISPTHWMPLPAPPAPSDGDRKPETACSVVD